MPRDSSDLCLSAVDPDAVEAFEDAVRGLGAHHPGTAAALGRALAVDPHHVGAHVVKGFANLILAREELTTVAGAALDDARRALAACDGGTADERVLVDALAAAHAGSFSVAIVLLDRGFAERPATFLPFKLAHALRFMSGDSNGMWQASEQMLRHWRRDNPAAGFLLGCHAFALEEKGDYGAAERFGREAVAIEPADAWGAHAVSHVFEMRGDTAGGIDWLEANRATWSRCNNFSFHMAWHLGLLHLERGDHDRVLALYDEEVRPIQSDDFRDMANAVSLLWRLDRSGVDVGTRWSDLAETARSRRTDTTLVFATLHTLVALVALNDRAGIDDLLFSLATKAKEDDEQARVAARVGLPLACVIAGLGGNRDALGRLVASLPCIGGSNAQRDLFMLLLAEAAQQTGNATARRHIHDARHRLKAEDHLIAAVDRRATAHRSQRYAVR